MKTASSLRFSSPPMVCRPFPIYRDTKTGNDVAASLMNLLAAAVNSTVVADENLTVGSTVWLPAESVAPGR